jgi:hypothetical protein
MKNKKVNHEQEETVEEEMIEEEEPNYDELFGNYLLVIFELIIINYRY